MIREYNPNSEREYTAPEAQGIVEPEPSIHKIPEWIKTPISYFMGLCLAASSCGFFLASDYRSEEMSKSEIEERVDKIYGDNGGLIKFVFDDLAKPGRELVYLMGGDGEQEK